MSSHKQLWDTFTTFLRSIELKNTSTVQFVSCLIGWLLSNRRAFPEESWNLYGLDQLTSIDCDRYEVEFTEESLHSTISRLVKQSPSSKDSITMIIRDVLWDCIVHKSEVECPNCGDDDLRVLVDSESREIVLACDICSWSQSKNGNKYVGDKKLRIAERSELDNL